MSECKPSDVLPLPVVSSSVREWLKAPPSQPRVLIEGLLYQKNKMLVAGSSKTRKTWALIALALCLAAGRRWLGSFPCVAGPVLYLDFELGRYALIERFRVVAKALLLNLEELPLHLYSFRDDDTRGYPSPEAVAERARGLAAGIPGLNAVLVDPVYRMCADLDDFSAKDMLQLVRRLEDVMVETGGGVIYADHYAKGDASTKRSIDRVAGSGVKARDADLMVCLTEHKEEGALVVEPTSRFFPPTTPFCVRWDFPLFVEADDLSARDMKGAAGGSEPEFFPSDVLIPLSRGPLHYAELKRECAKLPRPMSESTFKRRHKEAQELKLIHKEADGRYAVVPRGAA
jgi:hypothetical protein